MGADEAVELMRQLLWNTFVVSAPVLGAALAVGLLVSVFQVATQLQEMTLSYVPKLIVAALMLMALGPWMLNRVTHFAIQTFKMIPALAG
jgi:flagellar biosynthetic protein FliQ